MLRNSASMSKLRPSPPTLLNQAVASRLSTTRSFYSNLDWLSCLIYVLGQFKVEVHHLLKTACGMGSVTEPIRGYKAYKHPQLQLGGRPFSLPLTTPSMNC